MHFLGGFIYITEDAIHPQGEKTAHKATPFPSEVIPSQGVESSPLAIERI